MLVVISAVDRCLVNQTALRIVVRGRRRGPPIPQLNTELVLASSQRVLDAGRRGKVSSSSDNVELCHWLFYCCSWLRGNLSAHS
jgi:hypothetical protein